MNGSGAVSEEVQNEEIANQKGNNNTAGIYQRSSKVLR